MNGRYFFGIILVVLGLGFLLEQFNIISFGEIISIYWPSILILIGLVGLFDKKSSKFGDLILILLGAMLQINRLDIVDINVFKFFFPIILILIGLKVIFSREIKYEHHVYINKDGEDTNYKNYNPNRNITLEDTVDEFVVMGGIETNNQSENFKGGRVTAIMAGVEIDLRGAKLHNNEAYLDIKAIMGGVEITVPQDWRVEIKGIPIAGGWSNKTKFRNNIDAPVLKVNCFAMFGGIEVK